MKRLCCVDVGSGALEMLVVETDGKTTRTLDALRKSTALGRDCYALGSIRRETIADTCETLAGFRELLREYAVDECRVVATSALREAANRDWVLDQIRLSTGFSVEVLNNACEREWMLSALAAMPDWQKLRREGALVVVVGYGSTELTELREGELVMSRNIRLGALRLWELISSIASDNPHYPELLEELILSKLDHVRTMVRLKDIRNCVVLSGEADQLEKLSRERLTRKRFNQLYLDVKRMTPEQLEFGRGVPRDRAEILLPTMMVIKSFLDMTGAEEFRLSGLSLKDGAVAAMRQNLFAPEAAREAAEGDILSMARSLAKMQSADMRHARDVEGKALALFDELRALHGMGAREKLLLRLGALLHDMGKRLSTNLHGAQSAHILLANPIVGLTDVEQEIVAFLLENHSTQNVLKDFERYRDLGPVDRIRAAKLLALLKLADAMDAGNGHKLTLSRVALEDDRLTVYAQAPDEARLEKWVFAQKSTLFLESFGVKARLNVKKML